MILAVGFANCSRKPPVEYSAEASAPKTTVVKPVIAYIKAENTPMYDDPSSTAKVSRHYTQYEQIRIIPNNSFEFTKVTEPEPGFIRQSMVYSEQEMNVLLGEAIQHQKDLEAMIDKNMSYVRAIYLDVFSGPNYNSKLVGQVQKNAIIVLDRKYDLKVEWLKCVKPYRGYINKYCIYSPQQMRVMKVNQQGSVDKIKLAMGINPLSDPESASEPASERIRITTKPIKIRVPKLNVEKIVKNESVAKLLKRLESSTLATKIDRLLPNYGLIDDWNEPALGELSKYSEFDTLLIFPGDHDPDKKLKISVSGAFSPYHLPVEANFSGLGIPYGGSVEFSKSTWPVSFGVGYNSMRAQSNSEIYVLKTNDIFIYGKYLPLKLLKDKLEMYLTAGVGTWHTQLSNVKYPEHADYYPTQGRRGYGLTVGAGTVYEFRKFLIGLQYQLYGTPLIILGSDFIDPETQEELNNFIPTTQYKLYGGSNQLQLVIGYRIN